LLTVFASAFTAAVAEESAPNILYIFTDDQSYRTVSCYPRAYKYTRYAHPDRIEELYDLDKDPEELDNLAVKEEFDNKLLEMRAACIQSIRDNGGSVFADFLPPPKTRDTPVVGKPSGDTTVYYVEGKKRVHREGCRRLTTDPKILATMTKMTLAEAEEKGLPLCSRCPASTTPGKGNP
jgi:hypothetical protein